MKKIYISLIILCFVWAMMLFVTGVAERKKEKYERQWSSAAEFGRRAAISDISAEANPYIGHPNYCWESQAWLHGYLSQKEEGR